VPTPTLGFSGSGAASVRHVDPDREQACLAGVAPVLIEEVGCRAGIQRPPVGAAQHAGEHARPDRDFLDDLAALADPDQPAAETVRDPLPSSAAE